MDLSTMQGIVIRSAGKATEWLQKNKYPHSDNIPLSLSKVEFEGGGQYGVEIPVINSFSALEKAIRFLKSEGIYCTRFDETHGSFLLSDQEISEMLALCREENYGFLFGLGPRPEYDIKASFYRSTYGLEQGRQLNNNDAFRYAMEEAYRLVSLGCRGITVYDVGVMRALHEMRKQDFLPKGLILKTSSHCMASNPMIALIFTENGADSITTSHDLALPTLQEVRRLNPHLVLDVPTDVYKSKGGFIRFYELAEIVQVCAPVMLKMGGSTQDSPYDAEKEEVIHRRIKRVGVGLEYLEKFLPEKRRLSQHSAFACLPAAA